MLSTIWIYSLPYGIECLNDNLMHLRHQISIDIDIPIGIVLINILLKPWEAKLISILKVSIISGMLLHRIIGQMHKGVVNIFQVNAKLSGRGSQVALFEEEEVQVLVQKDPHTDVKFTVADQKWALNVFLDDESIVLDLVT